MCDLTVKEKKSKIKAITVELLKSSQAAMIKDIDRALNSGALDIENWDQDAVPMILPKSILIALLLSESEQYSAKGTSYEKVIKENVRNLLCFI